MYTLFSHINMQVLFC